MGTGLELRAAMEDLKLSKGELSKLCGVHYNTIWRWYNLKDPVPDYVFNLLSLIKGRSRYQILSNHPYRWRILRRHVFKTGTRVEFLTLAKQLHPDVSGRDTTEEFQQLSEAWNSDKCL